MVIELFDLMKLPERNGFFKRHQRLRYLHFDLSEIFFHVLDTLVEMDLTTGP